MTIAQLCMAYRCDRNFVDHDSLKQVVEANYAYLIFVLGSREKVESAICENIDFGHPRNYWSLDQAYFAIETALNKTGKFFIVYTCVLTIC